MPRLAIVAGQAPADLSQALGLRQLAKQHGHELIPAGEPLYMALGAMPGNQFVKPTPVENGNQLTVQACRTYNGLSSLVFGSMFFSQINIFPPRRILFNSAVALPSFYFSQKPVLEKSDLKHSNRIFDSGG
jgi:hypothetical protein